MRNAEEHIVEINETLKSTLMDVRRFEDSLVQELYKVDILGEDLIGRVRLAFHEAIVNVVIHTYKGDPSKDIKVRIVVDKSKILVVIRDYGEKVDITKIKSRDLNDLKENGLGVHFYRTIMDKVEYDTPTDDLGNIIRLTKKI